MYTYARKIDCEAMFWPNPGALCGYIGWYIGTGISPSCITFLFQSIYLQYEGFTGHCVCAASI